MSKHMTVHCYQKLMDRGWRRSGTTLYKPDLQRSCCPHYTIRLPVAEIKVSRHQRKTLHAWNRHVLGPSYAAQAARYHPKTRAQKKTDQQTFSLTRTIHAAEASHLPPAPPNPAHNYAITLEPDTFTEEKYALFEQYQRIVHHDPSSKTSKSGFRDFLCGSLLIRETVTIPQDQATDSGATSSEKKLGSYHQLHRLDGKLIALSVLDLLPHAVSAVYFIYLATPFRSSPSPPFATTPDTTSTTKASSKGRTHTLVTAPPTPETTNFATYSPGTLSALREASLALSGSYKYYYMGFYIHSCAKMRYKASFRPQYVLDPCTYGWDRFDAVDGALGVGKQLDAQKFVSTSRLRAGLPDQKLPYPTPKAAASAPSLFSLQLAGVPSLSELQAQTDLSTVRVRVRYDDGKVIVPISYLSGFEEGSWEEGRGVKGSVAELVAVAGVEVFREGVVVSFGA